MKPDMNNIDEVVKRYLPSAPEERIDSGTTRVLHELRLRPHRASEPTTERSMTTSWFAWKRLATISVVAVAILAAALSAGFWRNAPAIMEGSNQTLRFDEVVRSSSTGEVLLLADGSRVEMRAKSELLLERAEDGLKIRLNNGSVIVNAAKQRSGHLYVQTKDMTVSVIGTVFLVNAEEEGSRVAVIEGEVHVQQGTSETKLRPGQQVSTSVRMESLPVKEEIAWSPHAEAHLALLQQSTAVSPEPRETFEVISIRKRPEPSGGGARGAAGEGTGSGGRCMGNLQLDPSRFAATNAGIYFLVTVAYGLGDGRPGCMNAERAGILSGGPEWIKSATFDIEAVIPAGPPALVNREGWRNNRGTSVPEVTKEPGPRLRSMLRSMLEDLFNLKLRREAKETQVYILSVAKDGPKNLEPWKEGQWVGGANGYGTYEGVVNFPPPKHNYGDAFVGYVSGGRMSMDALAGRFPLFLKRPVLNRTGIAGYFNFEVFFAPPDSNTLAESQARAAEQGYKGFEGKRALVSPSLFKALEDELGLKLEPARAPVEIFTVQSVDRPSEN